MGLSSAGEPDRIGVLVVTGFLGSGKTTLVNRILTERHGERIAVVVNEFGDVPIDGRLVLSADEEIVELANGCVCCTVRGDLVRTIGDLLRRRKRRLFRGAPFERIVLETSGLASPGPVVQTLLLEPELARQTEPTGVVTLAHAERIVQQLGDHPEVEEQVGYADHLVLNHVDRVDERGLQAATDVLRARNAMATITPATRAGVEIAALFRPAGELRDWSAGESVGHAHTEGATTVVLESSTPLELHALKMWLQFLASKRDHELWRSKGVLACRGQEHAVVVQSVYQHLELGPGDEPAPEKSVLVLIGRGLDRGELERGWERVVGG